MKNEGNTNSQNNLVLPAAERLKIAQHSHNSYVAVQRYAQNDRLANTMKTTDRHNAMYRCQTESQTHQQKANIKQL